MGANIYRNKKLIWVFLLPAFAFMMVYLYYPFVQNIINSFQHIKYMGTSGGEWNQPWYGNYVKMLSDPKLRIALKNTGITIVATILGQVGIAVVLALLVSNIKRGSGFFRTVFFFPIVISATALGLLFNLIFLYDKGMVNQFLQFAGYLDRESNELIDWKSKHAMFTMLMPVIWQYVGFYFVILLTGLSGIPSELYEAATIDGANRLQRAVHITLPAILPIIVLNLILSVPGILNAGFDQLYNLCKPIVYESGDILDTFIYRIGLIDAQFGVATAMGMFKSVVSTLFISISYYCAYRFADYRIF